MANWMMKGVLEGRPLCGHHIIPETGSARQKIKIIFVGKTLAGRIGPHASLLSQSGMGDGFLDACNAKVQCNGTHKDGAEA